MYYAQEVDYSWFRFCHSSLGECLFKNVDRDYSNMLNGTLSCFRVVWYNCLYVVKVTDTSYFSRDLCHRFSLWSLVLTTDRLLKYTLNIAVHSSYTINITFTAFRMDKTPFGCKRNKMTILDDNTESDYCGVRDKWSEFSSNSTLKLIFTAFGVGSYFHVELSSTILDTLNGRDKYLTRPAEEMVIYRGSPRMGAYALEQLLTSWDPVLVGCIRLQYGSITLT